MVEILTDFLNNQLINICKVNIEEILKNMNNSVLVQVRRLVMNLTTDKTSCETGQLKSNSG